MSKIISDYVILYQFIGLARKSARKIPWHSFQNLKLESKYYFKLILTQQLVKLNN